MCSYFLGNENEHAEYRNIVIRPTEGRLRVISEVNSMYDPLQYVLLHPNGELGWCSDLKHGSRKITAMKYYSYRLAFRDGDSSLLHWGARLFQQYCVDQYIKIETDKLRWFQMNQGKIRTEAYLGVVDAIERG